MNYTEYSEQLFVFEAGTPSGAILFSGRPDRVLVYPESRVVIDRKFGFIPVQPAESNIQLRAYLIMNLAPKGFVAQDNPAFRPSNLLRRKLCYGSLALEGTIPPPPPLEDPTRYATEGRLLHEHMADPGMSRANLTPEQMEVIEAAEAMERDFIELVESKRQPGWAYATIVQPRVSSAFHTVAYSPADLQASRAEILALWKAAHQKDAQRHPSEDACRHCRATAICEEHKAWIMAVEKIAHLPAYAWNPDQWQLFLERKAALAKFLEDRYEEAKQIVAVEPNRIPGWVLKDGAVIRNISDIVGAWSRLGSQMTAAEFSKCCKIRLGDLERLVWQSRRGTASELSQKEVKQLINALLDGLIEGCRSSPSLVRSE